MEKDYKINNAILESIEKIDRFIEETTGQRASQDEIADALGRYFVMNEILEFIKMNRST